MKTPAAKALQSISRYHIDGSGSLLQDDCITVEEPLQIRLQWLFEGGIRDEIFSITMRTPGNDKFLAAGLLLAEGIIKKSDDLVDCYYESENGETLLNQLTVKLSDSVIVDLEKMNRRLISNSSCGICGKTSLKALEINHPPTIPEIKECINTSIILQLPEKLRQQQTLFQQSGGIHAAGLFSNQGDFIHCAEDVGRHNALDKLVGEQLLKNTLVSGTEIILLSGRASFELVQKTIMAGYAVLASVGAPSSLAITAAQQFNITLIGFVNKQSINVYTGMWRLDSNKL